MGISDAFPVYDGRGIVVSDASSEGIRFARYDLAMHPIGTSVLVASTNDTADHDSIADHKHILKLIRLPFLKPTGKV